MSVSLQLTVIERTVLQEDRTYVHVVQTDPSFSYLTEIFPYFFLSCKANVSVKFTKTGHGPHSSKLVVFVLFCCYSMNCLCVNVYCNTATG